jgi:hypothetical protein
LRRRTASSLRIDYRSRVAPFARPIPTLINAVFSRVG